MERDIEEKEEGERKFATTGGISILSSLPTSNNNNNNNPMINTHKKNIENYYNNTEFILTHHGSMNRDGGFPSNSIDNTDLVSLSLNEKISIETQRHQLQAIYEQSKKEEWVHDNGMSGKRLSRPRPSSAMVRRNPNIVKNNMIITSLASLQRQQEKKSSSSRYRQEERQNEFELFFPKDNGNFSTQDIIRPSSAPAGQYAHSSFDNRLVNYDNNGTKSNTCGSNNQEDIEERNNNQEDMEGDHQINDTNDSEDNHTEGNHALPTSSISIAIQTSGSSRDKSLHEDKRNDRGPTPIEESLLKQHGGNCFNRYRQQEVDNKEGDPYQMNIPYIIRNAIVGWQLSTTGQKDQIEDLWTYMGQQDQKQLACMPYYGNHTDFDRETNQKKEKQQQKNKSKFLDDSFSSLVLDPNFKKQQKNSSMEDHRFFAQPQQKHCSLSSNNHSDHFQFNFQERLRLKERRKLAEQSYIKKLLTRPNTQLKWKGLKNHYDELQRADFLLSTRLSKKNRGPSLQPSQKIVNILPSGKIATTTSPQIFLRKFGEENIISSSSGQTKAKKLKAKLVLPYKL